MVEENGHLHECIGGSKLGKVKWAASTLERSISQGFIVARNAEFYPTTSLWTDSIDWRRVYYISLFFLRSKMCCLRQFQWIRLMIASCWAATLLIKNKLVIKTLQSKLWSDLPPPTPLWIHYLLFYVLEKCPLDKPRSISFWLWFNRGFVTQYIVRLARGRFSISLATYKNHYIFQRTFAIMKNVHRNSVTACDITPLLVLRRSLKCTTSE